MSPARSQVEARAANAIVPGSCASMSYTGGSHTVFHHRYHIVWITKYRYKVLEGALRERIRTIIRQVCRELGVQIVSDVLSREHVHMFVEFPPHIAVSDFVRRVKGRSSHRVQMDLDFPSFMSLCCFGGMLKMRLAIRSVASSNTNRPRT
jgi:REP element-mobilizing transposase RayT